MKSFIVYTIPYHDDRIAEVRLFYLDAQSEEDVAELIWELEDGAIKEILKIEEVEDEEGG